MRNIILAGIVLFVIAMTACNVPPVEINTPCGYLNPHESVRCECTGKIVNDCPLGNCTETNYYCQGTCGECTCYQKDDMGDFYWNGNLYVPVNCSSLKTA